MTTKITKEGRVLIVGIFCFLTGVFSGLAIVAVNTPDMVFWLVPACGAAGPGISNMMILTRWSKGYEDDEEDDEEEQRDQ